MRKCFIYGLVDPRCGTIRYVGQSVDPERRIRHHIWGAKAKVCFNKAKSDWLCELVSLGIKPTVVILEETDSASWGEAERRWIAKLKEEQGHDPLVLLNLNNGGAGLHSHREETKAVLRQRAAEKANTPRAKFLSSARKNLLFALTPTPIRDTARFRSSQSERFKSLWKDPVFIDKVRKGREVRKEKTAKATRIRFVVFNGVDPVCSVHTTNRGDAVSVYMNSVIQSGHQIEKSALQAVPWSSCSKHDIETATQKLDLDHSHVRPPVIRKPTTKAAVVKKPTTKAVTARVSYPTKRPLSSDDQQKLVAACKDDLERLLVFGLLDTGMRVPEWCALDGWKVWEHIRFTEAPATMRVGKRYVPVSRRLKHAFSSYFAENALGSGMPLKARKVEYLLREIGARAKLKLTPAMLRLSFCSNALDAGISERALRSALGHWPDSVRRLCESKTKKSDATTALAEFSERNW